MTTTDLEASSWGIAWRQNHVDVLTDRAVSQEIAAERGYRTVLDKAQLDRAGFSRSQKRPPGLLIPLHDVRGQSAGYQYRPDSPRLRDGKRVKYETRTGQKMVLDVPPRVQSCLDDPSATLWITEGPIKADALASAGVAAVALLGVYGWRRENDKGGKTVTPDLEHIAFNGRRVVLAFDADASTNRNVHRALSRLAGVLESRGASVGFLVMPDLGDGKSGVDDWLAANGPDLDQLEALVEDELGPEPAPPVTEEQGSDGHHFTDLGNAHRLIANHGHELRYIAPWGSWLTWDGTRFATDPGDVRVTDLASSIPRRLFADAGDDSLDRTTRDNQLKWAKRSESATALAAAVRLARSVPGVAIDHAQLDADKALLNVENGTVDLGTGELLDHDPERLITKLAPVRYEPEATAPTFDAYLERVLPDADVRAFVQRAVGYSLSGEVSEQVLFFVTGVGANGKSVLMSTISRLLGDYATTAPKDLLLATRHEPHPTSMTQLFGARFASAIETEAGAKLAEAQVKQLTGGDEITARRMREDFWTFAPTHKLWLACNHLPKINGRDHAIWRRIRVVPFNVVIPEDERDPHLVDTIEAELSGVLNWALEGHRQWRANGLEVPRSVAEATAEYRQASDWLTRFCAEKGYVIEPGVGSTLTTDLRKDVESWSRDEGLTVGRVELARALEDAGCEPVRTKLARLWRGISRED